MTETEENKLKMYEELGISPALHKYGESIEDGLSERFGKIDKTAEYNQLKVISAMQKAHVSEACLSGTTGYGYDDIGRDALESLCKYISHGRCTCQTADHMRNTRTGSCTYEQPAPGR